MPRFDSASVPAIIDDIRQTDRRGEVHYDPQPAEPAIATVEVLAHLIVGVIVGWGMWLSRSDVALAMLTGVGYFAMMTTLRILAKTDTLKDWLRSTLEYRLEKHRINTLADLADRHFDLMELEAQAKQPQVIREGVRTPSAQNYVPPHTPDAIAEAIAWAEGLYDAGGNLDRRKLHPNGKVKGVIVGSKRDKHGTEAAQQYLVSRGFLAMKEGGGYINIRRYPTTVELSQLRAKN